VVELILRLQIGPRTGVESLRIHLKLRREPRRAIERETGLLLE
jgi:hypothetical protein